MLQILLAFFEGMALIASPCILPILPLILAGSVGGTIHRPLEIVIGFIISFTIFSLISRQLLLATGIHTDTIQWIAYLALFIFGFLMVVPKAQTWFSIITSKITNHTNASIQKPSTFRNGFMMGGLIGIVWIPCAGPILAIALIQIIQAKTTVEAIFTLFAFSIGAGIPMLFIGYGSQFFIQHLKKLNKHTEFIRKLMGILIMIVSLFGLFGMNLAEWLTSNKNNTELTVLSGNTLINPLTVNYPAPEIIGIKQWINTPPLTIQSLRGKVILVDFWTYSCINCIRTLPYLTSWYKKYHDKGFTIIGVHAPEFEFEKNIINIKRAVINYGITYPVAVDNDFTTWTNYQNQYWPAHYLIDRDGRVVYVHFGEGDDAITEHNIRILLGLKADPHIPSEKSTAIWGQTPELYLGSERKTNYKKEDISLPLHHWTLKGNWTDAPQFIESKGDNNELYLHFYAKNVYMVASSSNNKPVKVLVKTDKDEKTIIIKSSELYTLLKQRSETEGIMTITVPKGVRLYTFTFGE